MELFQVNGILSGAALTRTVGAEVVVVVGGERGGGLGPRPPRQKLPVLPSPHLELLQPVHHSGLVHCLERGRGERKRREEEERGRGERGERKRREEEERGRGEIGGERGERKRRERG